MEHLSALVITDILSALPFRQNVRLCKIGSPIIKIISSRTWVLNRVSNVMFCDVMAAPSIGGNFWNAVFSDKFLRRLNGMVYVDEECLSNKNKMKIFLKIIKRVPGYISLTLGPGIPERRFLTIQELVKKVAHFREKVLYVQSWSNDQCLFKVCSNLLYYLTLTVDQNTETIAQIEYRQTYARHIIDIAKHMSWNTGAFRHQDIEQLKLKTNSFLIYNEHDEVWWTSWLF